MAKIKVKDGRMRSIIRKAVQKDLLELKEKVSMVIEDLDLGLTEEVLIEDLLEMKKVLQGIISEVENS